MNDPTRLPGAGRRLSRRAVYYLILLSAALLLAPHCGDDNAGAPPIEDGLQGLQSFGAGAAASTEGRVLQEPAVTSLLTAFGLSIEGTVPRAALRPEELDKGGAAFPRQSAVVPQLLLEGFGTYDRDSTSTAEPFPGWVLAEAGVPADGFIFRFKADDDIVIIEPGGPRHLAGEIRFLEIALDDNATPADPSDDVLTHVNFEISIVDETPDPLVRLEYTATLDENRDPETISIGDESDLDASYVGDISIAIGLNGVGDDFSGLIQLVDRAPDPDYAVRFGFSATDLDSTDTPHEAAFTFAFGPTNDPLSPPWLISAAFTNFRFDSNAQDVIADVTGTITYNGNLAATFEGDTGPVQVDVDTDGDGDVDENDTCIDVNITRTGSDESENICEAFGDLVDTVPFAGGGGGPGFRVPLLD